MRIKRHGSAIVVALLALTAPLAARAQSASEKSAAAEALFREAKALMDTGATEEACAKFAASQRVDPAIGTLLNLARCHEQLGRTASAWAEYIEAATEARRARQSARQAEAEQRVAALEPKLTRLLIDVPDDVRVPALEIRRDEMVIEPAAWGTAVPVDPGLHSVSADAPGKVRWSKTVDARGEGRTTTLRIPTLADAEVPPPTVAPEPAVAPAAPPPAQPSHRPAPSGAIGTDTLSTSGTQRTIGLIVGGAGIVGLAAGGYLGLTARSKWNDAACPNNICPTRERQTLAEDAKTYAAGSTVAFAGGGALLATGLLLYFTAPEASKPATAGSGEPPTGIQVGAGVLAGETTLTVQGAF